MDNFILNAKAGCLYEKLTGKNFFKITTEEEILYLTYAIYVINNQKISFDLFCEMLNNKHFAKNIGDGFKNIGEFNKQFKVGNYDENNEQTDENNEQKEENISLTDICSVLIVKYKIDPHYVYYEMDLWEIVDYFKWAETCYHAEMEEKRMWAFLLIPFHDGKMKKPDDLFKFPWESDNSLRNLEANKDAIKRTFAAFRKKKQEDGGFNTTVGPTGYEEAPKDPEQSIQPG